MDIHALLGRSGQAAALQVVDRCVRANVALICGFGNIPDWGSDNAAEFLDIEDTFVDPNQNPDTKPTSGTLSVNIVAVNDFHGAIDDYLAFCEEEGTAPEVAYKGSLNVRFKKSDTHRRAAIYAITHQQSLNSFIEEAVEEKLERA